MEDEFIDKQKTYYYVNWTKLMQILNGTGIDQHGRRMITKLYMYQSVTLKMDQGRQKVWKLEEGLDKDVVCHVSYSTFLGIPYQGSS